MHYKNKREQTSYDQKSYLNNFSIKKYSKIYSTRSYSFSRWRSNAL